MAATTWVRVRVRARARARARARVRVTVRVRVRVTVRVRVRVRVSGGEQANLVKTSARQSRQRLKRSSTERSSP